MALMPLMNAIECGANDITLHIQMHQLTKVEVLLQVTAAFVDNDLNEPPLRHNLDGKPPD